MKKILLILTVFIIGCSGRFPKSQDDEVLARAYNNYLYKSELSHLISPGTSVKDSIIIVRNYINKWVKQQLIIKKAEQNLTDQQKDFSKQLEEYRNSLIVYQYENHLIFQKLDTIVDDSDVEAYYEHNKKNFELKDNIVKVHYVILSLDSTENQPVRNLMTYTDTSYIDVLEDFCKTSATEYYLEDQWIPMNDVLKVIPLEVYNEQEFLQENSYVETEDSLYKYYIKFNDYKIKDSVSPLAFEKQKIKNIIINKRKLKLLEEMRNEVYNTALENNDFEVFR